MWIDREQIVLLLKSLPSSYFMQHWLIKMYCMTRKDWPTKVVRLSASFYVLSIPVSQH